MKIKLEKNWRHAGQVIMAGTEIEITDKNTIKFLEENAYLYKKEKKEKKGKVKIAKENN